MTETVMPQEAPIVTKTLLGLAVLLCLGSHLAAAGILEPYADPRQQTDLAFGHRSYWHQPWRAYVDTWPATRLVEGTGVNFNVPAGQAEAVARHLAKNGFRHVRIEIGWGSFNYDDPRKLNDRSGLDALLGACKRYGLRPLLLLNGHHGYPCPIRGSRARLAQDAPQGAREVTLENAGEIKPGYTGFREGFGDYWACRVLITDFDPGTGVAKLSRPLPGPLKAGDQDLYTLKYQPFGPLKLPDGTPNPAGLETLAGWRTYVQGLSTAAKEALGTQGAPDAGFDLEVWNELTFGSNFLSINNYYEPKKFDKFDWVIGDMLAATVSTVNDPASGLPGVHVGDGFNNQWPWGSGSQATPGIWAINKHPYSGFRRFPEADDGQGAFRLQPLNALGKPDGSVEKRDYFRPKFDMLQPEYFFQAYQTEHIIRDVSPFTTDIYGTLHGRFTHPPGSHPVTMWITEVNVAPCETNPKITAPEALFIKGKSTLRFFCSGIGKGVEFMTLFAAKDSDVGLGLVSDSFFKAIEASKGAYPEDDAPVTSPAMLATRNLVRAMGHPEPIRYTRAVELSRLEEPEERVVFQGDGTPEHPTLHNRDIFAFLPFQVNDHSFAIPYCVMTRNLMEAWRAELPAGDPARYDFPPQDFILDLKNVRGQGAQVAAYDPLRNQTRPVRVLAATSSTLRLRVQAVDYPCVLQITEDRRGPLILDPRLTAAPDGAGRLRFRTNLPTRATITAGPDGRRTGLLSLDYPDRASEREVELGQAAGPRLVRVTVRADDLIATWPEWDEDVEGR